MVASLFDSSMNAPVGPAQPAGVARNTPPFPPGVHPEYSVSGPAPRSEVTTATCRLGSPPGNARSVLIRIGKFAIRLAWFELIEAESSIMNRMSASRFWARGVTICTGVDSPSSGRPLQSSSTPLQISGAGTTSPAQAPQAATPPVTTHICVPGRHGRVPDVPAGPL